MKLGLLVLLAACDSGSPVVVGKDAAPPVPAGPYVVRHTCSHSNEPFGKGGSQNDKTVDLATKTELILDYVYTGEPTPAGEPPPLTRKPLDAGRLATIEAALAKVLEGGPFEGRYAVPEGISCQLEVSAAGKRFLVVQRSPYGAPLTDAVTVLINAL